jgi:REP element-mobilizing transposase RayT
MQLPETSRRQYHDTFSQQYLEALDKGLGACVLRRRELREVVGDSLRHFDGDRYRLGDFVVMPNHVHLMVCLLGDTKIESQCTSWKRFTARQINQSLGTRGRFWQEESFDHLIRSAEQFEAIQRYIGNNPANLPQGDYLLYQPNVAGTFQVSSADGDRSGKRCGPHGVCLLQQALSKCRPPKYANQNKVAAHGVCLLRTRTAQ